jgi:hypothetical protein
MSLNSNGIVGQERVEKRFRDEWSADVRFGAHAGLKSDIA